MHPPGEDPHVTAPDEVVVVEAEQRVGGGEELWVEHHLGGTIDHLGGTSAQDVWLNISGWYSFQP